MDVISYRGPGAAGGVSTGLESAWRTQRTPDTAWWFLNGQSLSNLKLDSTNPEFITQLSDSTVKGHYQFCNNFLWPIMHDLPVHSTFDQMDFEFYKELNRIFGEFIAYEQRTNKRYFVNDYQLTLLPEHLAAAGGNVSVFWHIPWPKKIPAEHNKVIREIVRGLLNSKTIGFHTQEYAENFMSCIALLVPEAHIDRHSMRINAQTNTQQNFDRIAGLGSFMTRPLRFTSKRATHAGTQIVVAPLGINMEQWSTMSSASADARVASLLHLNQRRRLVLSVDRADYTKSVHERILIIDRFLTEHSSWRDRVSFVQICGRSRGGLKAFDQYWEKCHETASAINERWRTADWQPINWIEEPLPASSLAVLYRHADAMLVTPVRDGLNLTAKEFVACQYANPGVLLLSPGAGAWQELGQHALPADPMAPHATADAIAHSLTMPPIEKEWRNVQLKRSLNKNPLRNWWRALNTVGYAHSVEEVSEIAAEDALSA